MNKGVIMNKNGPPKEPTPFAKLLGCTALGEFFPDKDEYVVEFSSFNKEAVNFFGTVHGGAILGLCDDFCGMAIYHKYGVNSAVTINIKSSDITYLRPVRPSSKLTFFCKISPEVQGAVYLHVTVKLDDKVIATMTATWHMR